MSPVAHERRPAAWRTGWLVRGAALAAVGALVLAPTTGPTPSTAPTARVASPETAAVALAVPASSSAHPYSTPGWSPLRAAAQISCVKTNCTGSGGDYHGYWAIDFLGQRGDPVHAAGAGVFHIGARQATCAQPGTQTDGVWAWIDHGGGVVSKYTHLDAVAATEGQLVTPATVIGSMGHWGDAAPCSTNYLHFEVREGGLKGTRVDPRSLRACVSGGGVTMPGIFGVSSFDALTARTKSTPVSTSDCVVDYWNRTPARPAVSASRRPSAAKLSWGTPPAGTSSIKVTIELYSPSVKKWNDPVYRTYPGTSTGATVTGLANGRTYRVKVAFKNGSGWSAWSSTKSVVPATVPSAPKAPRALTSPTRDYIHYAWWKSSANGSTVTSYTTQVRCYRSGRYRAWTTRSTKGTTYYYNHRGLTGYGTCQVRVRANNAMGPSAWSKTSTIRKRT